MAKHWCVGLLCPVNWVIIHRPASGSYNTIGSPALNVSHRPPKPTKRLLMLVGPYCDAPVVLSNTWNIELTLCTYWLRPTSPLVSGGIGPFWLYIPSKVIIGVGITRGPSTLWRT